MLDDGMNITPVRTIDITPTSEGLRYIQNIAKQSLEQYLRKKEELEKLLENGLDWDCTFIRDDYRDLVNEAINVGCSSLLDSIEEAIMKLKEGLEEFERCGF